MEYQVPQFIEVESRIVGPLTLKQFIYLAGTIGICVAFFVYLPLYLAVIFSAPLAGLGGALAFYRMNGKPFIDVLEAGFNYYTGPKLFLWKHAEPKAPSKPVKMDVAPTRGRAEPRLTRGRLSELAWSLDVKPGGESNDLER